MCSADEHLLPELCVFGIRGHLIASGMFSSSFGEIHHQVESQEVRLVSSLEHSRYASAVAQHLSGALTRGGLDEVESTTQLYGVHHPGLTSLNATADKVGHLWTLHSFHFEVGCELE